MRFIYDGMHYFSQFLRARNYALYRRVVEFTLFQKIIQALSGEKHVEVLSPENYRLCVNPIYHGHYLSSKKIVQYEPEIRAVMKSIVQPGMVVYDVGANAGVFSLCLASLVGDKGRVYAFEPEQNNLKCLIRTKEINALDHLEIFPVCAGEESGVAYFDRRGGSFSGRLVDETAPRHANVISVKVVSLDDFVYKNQHEPPHLIKIDVEGQERKVFKGMPRILNEYTPIIICELHRSLDPRVADLFDVLQDKGYESYDIHDWAEGGQPALRDFNRTHHFISFLKKPETAKHRENS